MMRVVLVLAVILAALAIAQYRDYNRVDVVKVAAAHRTV